MNQQQLEAWVAQAVASGWLEASAMESIQAIETQEAERLFIRQGQRFALVGGIQAIDQGLDLQLGDFLAQAFAQACTHAVGQVVSVAGGRGRGGMGQRHKAQQRQKQVTRHGGSPA